MALEQTALRPVAVVGDGVTTVSATPPLFAPKEFGDQQASLESGPPAISMDLW